MEDGVVREGEEQQLGRSELEELLNTSDITGKLEIPYGDKYAIRLEDSELYRRLSTYKICKEYNFIHKF